ncbi:malto-oligosyltrehalose trehalohydrolase, partial [Mycobacterium kansasii]
AGAAPACGAGEAAGTAAADTGAIPGWATAAAAAGTLCIDAGAAVTGSTGGTARDTPPPVSPAGDVKGPALAADEIGGAINPCGGTNP